MSSHLKKGQRQNQRQLAKSLKKDLIKFNKTLMAMNQTYHMLLEDESLTEENFLERVKEVSSFKFTERQLGMLKNDLLYGKEDNYQ